MAFEQVDINDEQNVAFVNEVLEDWTAITLNDLKRSIQNAGLELTEDLLNSLRVEVMKAAAGDLARANFYFRMHGRWKDMRTVYKNYSGSWRQSGFPPIEAIKEFITKVGVEKFKYVPGYKMGTFPAENIAVRRLAWGIAIGIGKRNTIKAKKWYAKTFYSQITPLIEALGGRAAQAVAKGVKDNLDDKTVKI
jgi:hypothetical protein